VGEEREVIPAGTQPAPWYLHLIPLAKFLVEERGHMPLEEPEEYGWVLRNGMNCHLTRSITEEDWEAVNAHFVVPSNLVYIFGRIRDQANKVQLIGHDTIIDVDGEIPIEVWEERQRARGDVPWFAVDQN
jgi:hypothetical protein